MDVTLVNYTGFGLAPNFAARLLIEVKNTRVSVDTTKWTHEQTIAELEAISKTIRSSWEFVDYHFLLNGVSRACADQIVRTRNGSYAVQAQRVADMSSFDYLVPNTVIAAGPEAQMDWDSCMRFIRGSYQSMREYGIPAQDARGVLPMSACTNLHIKWNLRTFADIVGKRENLRVQDEYVEVVRAMKELVLGVHPWAGPFLNPERTQTPALDAILREALGGGSPVDKPQVNDALKELDALKGTWG